MNAAYGKRRREYVLVAPAHVGHRTWRVMYGNGQAACPNPILIIKRMGGSKQVLLEAAYCEAARGLTHRSIYALLSVKPVAPGW